MRTAVMIVAAALLAGPAVAHEFAAASAGTAAATPAAKPLPTREDGYFQEVVPVAEGVWMLAQPGFQVQPVGNVTVVEQADGLVLVDAGGSPGSGRRIVELVRGLSPKPVKAVILTHWHGDHPQGLSEILRAWPRARTIATAVTREHLRTPKTMNSPAAPDPVRNAKFLEQVRGFQSYIAGEEAKATNPTEKAGWGATLRMMNQYEIDMDGALTQAPDEGFDERLLLDDPVRPVEAVHLGRANTDGDALVWLPKQRVLATGDVVVAPFPYGFGSFSTEWLDVLDKVKVYDPAVLIPGHGPAQHDLAYVERVRALIVDVRRQVRGAAAEGLSAADARKRVDVADLRRGFTGDDPWLNRWFDQFWTDPIVASAWKEAKGEPITQGLN